MVSQAKGGCKECGSMTHTSVYHSRKPIKRGTKSYIGTDGFMHVSSGLQDVFVKKPRKKAASKTLLKKKLEKLVKDYVKKRDNYTCQHCGKVVEGVNCHASHVIPVSRSGYLQFDPLNMKVLDYHCHINWWHKHPVEAGKWFTDTFPERWEYLQSLHIKRMKPMNEAELQEKIDYYKGLLK